MSRVVLIAGASGGIGRAAASLLAARGHRLALFARDAARLQAVDAAGPAGPPLRLVGDPCRRPDVERAVAATVDRLGRLDAAVLAVGAGVLKPALDLTDDDLDDLLDANLRSAFLVAQAAARSMAASGGGTIVAIPGILGRAAMRNAAGYAASKFAVVGLLKSMALDLQRQGVRFSLLYLGGVDTPFWDRVDLRVQRDKMLRPEDAAAAVLAAVEAPPHGVLGELTLQPESHQL